jgi:ribosomal protein L17
MRAENIYKEGKDMYRKNKLDSFHISKEEKLAIDMLRKNGINTSSFLRRQLRKFAEQLILRSQNSAIGGIPI